MISRALGGKTGRALNGWECGLKNITINNAMYSKPYGHQLPSSLNIIKIHQDEVCRPLASYIPYQGITKQTQHAILWGCLSTEYGILYCKL